MNKVDLHYLLRITCILTLGGLGLLFLFLIKVDNTYIGLVVAAVCIVVAGKVATKIEDWIKKPDRR